ncbi:hypothetical protein KCP70_21285 [Salmonella enterica subsp. enterica]|nr:hypothetical protein KCP70_21285 [Salmonella enterica subsp. enterica]
MILLPGMAHIKICWSLRGRFPDPLGQRAFRQRLQAAIKAVISGRTQKSTLIEEACAAPAPAWRTLPRQLIGARAQMRVFTQILNAMFAAIG